MAHYILDTNILSYLIDINSSKHIEVVNFFRSMNKNDLLSTTIITIIRGAQNI